MKRHQVMDLFHCNQTEPIGEWNKIDYEYLSNLPQPESRGCKVKVKLSDLSETFAYFYKDKCQWIESYGGKPSYFWECSSKEPLNDVIEWKKLKEVESD